MLVMTDIAPTARHAVRRVVRSASTALLVIAVSAAMVPAVTSYDAPTVPAAAATRVAEPSWRVRPSWQVDGRVLDTVIVNGVVVVGGLFNYAIGPSGERVPARNVAAFRLSDGRHLPRFAPNADGVVRALAVSGGTLWIGGYFHTVNGVARRGLARLDLATGALHRGFDARLNDGVEAIVVARRGLVVGGKFTRAGGASRAIVARLNAATGRADKRFQARLRGSVVRALAVTGTRVWVGGHFNRAGGRRHAGLVSIDARSGRLRGRQPTRVPGVILSLAQTPRLIIGGTRKNRLVAWRKANLTVQWRRRTLGDVQALEVHSGRLYVGTHDGLPNRRQAKIFAVTAARGVLLRWEPRIPDYWGIFAIDATTRGLVVGGRITRIDGVPARGWGRFLP